MRIDNIDQSVIAFDIMKRYSTREAAQALGLDWRTIQRYLAARKIPAPPVERIGGGKYRAWTIEDIARVRSILPKIKNGRKTRYKKKRLVHGKPESATVGNTQLAKTKTKSRTKTKQDPPPGAAVPHKKSQKRK